MTKRMTWYSGQMNNVLKNRYWVLKFSFFSRRCYISGDILRFQWCYRGRKKVWYPIVGGGNYLNDDIWISQNEYLTLLSKGIA